MTGQFISRPKAAFVSYTRRMLFVSLAVQGARLLAGLIGALGVDGLHRGREVTGTDETKSNGGEVVGIQDYS